MSILAYAAGVAAVTAVALVGAHWGPAKLAAATRRSSKADSDMFEPLDLEALVGGPAQRRAIRPVFSVAPEDRGEFPGDRKLAPVARTWDKKLGRYVDAKPGTVIKASRAGMEREQLAAYGAIKAYAAGGDAAMEAFVAKQRAYLNGEAESVTTMLDQRDIDHANFVKGFEAAHPDNVVVNPIHGSNTWRGTGAARIATALALLGSLALSACGSTPTQQASLVAAGTTLAAIAAANNTTVAKVVSQGALFCQSGGAAGVNALTVAVATVAGLPASVTGQTSQAVAQTCGALSMVPVPPPAAPESVPVLVAPTTLPSVGSLTSAPAASQSFYQPDPARGLKA